MNAAISQPADVEMGDLALPPRKRFKASELPLTQNQRSAIDSLLHTFKKKGEFDVLRKSIYAQFADSDAKSNLVTSITQLAETELDKNPVLLSKDRRQAAPLIEGAAERSEIYKAAEQDIDRIFDTFLKDAEQKLRDIRRADVGPDIAAEEQKRGSKSDEDYARDSDIRRQAWARLREQELQRQRELEEEEERQREEERRKKQAEEDAKEKARALEREREKKRQEEWAKELEERRERKKRQDAQWERERLEKDERERKKRELEREKEIEAAALEELLAEGKRLAAKSTRVEDTPVKEPGSKESALAAIMKAEKLEREKAKLNDTSAEAATEQSQLDATTDASPTPAGPSTSSAGVQWKTNLWVRDGPKPNLKTPVPENAISSSMSPDQKKLSAISSSTDPHQSVSHAPTTSKNQKPRDTSPRRPSTKDRLDQNRRRDGSRSRSPRRASHIRQERERSRSRDRIRGRDERRQSDRKRSRSTSRSNHSTYRDRNRDRNRDRTSPPARTRSKSQPRRRSRSRDPKDIDRYVPASNRSKDDERDRRPRDRDQDRPRANEQRRESRPRPRPRDLDGATDEAVNENHKGKDKSPHRDRHTDPSQRPDSRTGRDRSRTRRLDNGRRRSRSRSRSYSRNSDRGTRKDKDTEAASTASVQIDRYMPSTSYRAKRGELDNPARARTHALAGSQQIEDRKQSNDKVRDRDSVGQRDRDDDRDRARDRPRDRDRGRRSRSRSR